MNKSARTFHLFSDETRLRILMLLGEGELFVCQIMAVLGISQPLVSRNLALMRDAGLVDERREKKLVFYSLKKNLIPPLGKLIAIMKDELREDPVILRDREVLADCRDFQKRKGECDMKTFLEYVQKRRMMKKAS